MSGTIHFPRYFKVPKNSPPIQTVGHCAREFGWRKGSVDNRSRISLNEGKGSQSLPEVALTEPLGRTHVSLKHVVVFLFGAERFLQHGDVTLVVGVLLLQGLHLRGQRKNFLVSLLNLQPGLLQLHRRGKRYNVSAILRQQSVVSTPGQDYKHVARGTQVMVAYTTGADWGTHAHRHIHTCIPNMMTVLKVYSLSLKS